jgi:hypothetical protein
MTVCEECGRPSNQPLCFRCKIATIGFTYRGAHPGHHGWHEGTVRETKREIYEGAREQGIDITRA